MGRPQKQTVDYFPHYANSGKTMFILENKFGNNGYAFWFKLLEILAITEGHYFRVENSIDWEFLLAKTKVSDETATEILNTLAGLEAIDKELWNKKIIWVQNFVDNLSEVYRKRKISAPIKPFSEGFRDGNYTTSEVSGDINPQRREEESKVEKSKVKESKEEKEKDINVITLTLCKEVEKLTCGKWYLAKDIQALNALIEMYTFDWVRDAIVKTISRNKVSLEYAKGILNNWAIEGKEEGSHGNIEKNTPEGEGKYTGFKPKEPELRGEIDSSDLI